MVVLQFAEPPNCFPQRLRHLAFPPTASKCFCFSTSSQRLPVFTFLIITNRCKVDLLAICIVFFGEIFLQVISLLFHLIIVFVCFAITNILNVYCEKIQTTTFSQKITYKALASCTVVRATALGFNSQSRTSYLSCRFPSTSSGGKRLMDVSLSGGCFSLFPPPSPSSLPLSIEMNGKKYILVRNKKTTTLQHRIIGLNVAL